MFVVDLQPGDQRLEVLSEGLDNEDLCPTKVYETTALQLSHFMSPQKRKKKAVEGQTVE